MDKPQKQKNNKMPYMKYLMDGLTPELIKKAERELGETEEVKKQCLKELKSLIKNEPDFNPCMDETFLLRFLRSKKYKVDRAFKTLKSYYVYKATYSGIITDFTPSDVKDKLEWGLGCALEYRDANYTGIGFIRFGDIDLKKLTLDEMIGTILVCAELGINMESISIAGYALIFDFKNASFHTIRSFASPTFLYRLFTAVQDCIPCRIRGYHVVHQPAFFNIFFSIAKTFMSEKLAGRFHLHGSDMKSLYEHIPQEILPEELGGKQAPLSKFLFNDYLKKLYSMEDHFIRMRKYGFTGKTLQKLQKDNPHAILT